MNGIKTSVHQNGHVKKLESTEAKESFEPIPLLAAFFTYLGFYFLIFCGYISQFFFPPKVATEKNREVCGFFSRNTHTHETMSN